MKEKLVSFICEHTDSDIAVSEDSRFSYGLFITQREVHHLHLQCFGRANIYVTKKVHVFHVK